MRAIRLEGRRLRDVLVILALVALSAACTLMLEYRVHRAESLRYSFLTWNLILAWIPVPAAFLAVELSRSRSSLARSLSLPFAALWLVFLPNAPYLATDLIHLSPRPNMPYWYDAMMLSAYAGTGVLLGLASLLLMQDTVARLAGRALSWLFASMAILLTAFGIYLGRFERLNSWEVFSSPSVVVEEIWTHLSDPVASSRAFEFTIIIGAMLIVAYVVLFGVTERGLRLLTERARRR